MQPERRSSPTALPAGRLRRTRGSADDTGGGSDRRPERRLAIASVLVALVPIAVSVTRAIHRQWIPVGDNAFFAIRAQDVGSRHHPLLGTWTSASLTAKTNINNPGPLFFDVLALPQRLAQGGAGLAVAVALLNGLAVVGIAVFAHRRGGTLLSCLAMLATTVLGWSMGSELLYDPWQPHSLLLPFLFFMVLVWSATCGDLAAVPFTVGVGSLIVQTHLSYGFLVPGLGAWAVAGLAFELRRRRRQDPGQWAALRRSAYRAAVRTGVVAGVCWAQPLIEQLTGEGQGNLSRLAGTLSGSGSPVIGFRLSARLAASILALPPWWLRPSFSQAFRSSSQVGPPGGVQIAQAKLPSMATAAFALVVVIGALAGCTWLARRRRDRDGSLAAVTALVVLALGLYTNARVPIGVFGIAQHQFRWMWPFGAFASLALAAVLARSYARPSMGVTLAGVFAGATALVALANLPASTQLLGPQYDLWSQPVIKDLNTQIARSREKGPILVDIRGIRFAEPFSTPFMEELQRQGTEFVVADEGLVRQLGTTRRFNGRNATSRLFYRQGDDALASPLGARRIAFHMGLGTNDLRELARLKEQLAPALRSGLRLTARGRMELDRNDARTLEGLTSDHQPDSVATFQSRVLVRAVRDKLVHLDGPTGRLLRRYADLQFNWDRETVAVFVAPVASRP